jgi:hypothetical protein
MRRAFLITSFLSLLFTACGGAPSTPMVVQPQTVQLHTSTPPPPTLTASPAPTSTTILPTSTPAPTSTETLLPPLELPTLALNPPALAIWDGTPTYLADSQPGYAFRVRYDPEIWALVTDQLGQPALGHRNIPYCMITPSAGRGLPPTLRVEHDVIYPGNLSIDVTRAYQNDVLAFATYQVSDSTVFTGFVVDFQEESEACLADALAVISSLRSVPISQATP